MVEPRNIGPALDRVLGGLTASTRPLVGVMQAWDGIVGPAIAAHCRPRRLDGTTLVVEVDDPRWVTQLKFLREQIVEKINDHNLAHNTASQKVERIDLRVVGARGSTSTQNRPE
jgi:hypothetical protein